MIKLEGTLTDTEKREGLGNLLELWLEVWPHCHLHCAHCFNGASGAVDPSGLLTREDYEKLIQEFKALGGKVIGIPGNGEPMHARNYPLTLAIATIAHELGIRVSIFTAGDLLTPERISELRRLNVSLSIKHNSAKASVEDRIVGREGYTLDRSRAIQLLQDAGFMDRELDADSHPTSRVAFVTSILKENYAELPEFFRHCLSHNIVPNIDTVLSLGRGNLFPKPDDEIVRSTFLGLQRIAKDEFNDVWEISPTYVGGCCDRHGYHLYVDCWGNVSPCLGANKNGIVLVRKEGQDTLTRAWNTPLMANLVRPRAYTGACTDCTFFKAKTCNSCLGRFTSIVSSTEIRTIGCWSFKR